MSTLKPLVAFEHGDIIDITIKGAFVERVVTLNTGSIVLRVEHPDFSGQLELSPTAPGVTVERVAPAAWPPRTGDLWRDDNGMLYLGLQRVDDERLDLISVAGDMIPQDELLDRKPTLVHREGAGT